MVSLSLESYHSHLRDSHEASSTRLPARAHAAIPCPTGAGRARLAARRKRWSAVGFHGHAAPSGEEAQTSRPPLAAKSARCPNPHDGARARRN